MPDRSYDVVATSFPIVYTNDGDHDRDGMLYTLSCYTELLAWARRRWNDGEQWLPRTHRRRQLVQIVVDGLSRYELMVERLEKKRGPERALLAERSTETLHVEEEDAPRDDRGDTDPNLLAVQQNYRATVAELLAALDELTGGAVTELPAEPSVCRSWQAQWRQALTGIDTSISRWFTEMEADPDRRFDADRLSAKSGVPVDRVRRLLLNDRRTGLQGDRDATGPYDRFNPMRPIPLVHPLVLRARAGETVEVRLRTEIRGRSVGLHVQGAGLGGQTRAGEGDGVQFGDGADVGRNPSTLARPGRPVHLTWRCLHQGVWPVNDLGDVRGSEQGTNIHGLFGALVVEPPGAAWHDPETGEDLTDAEWAGQPDVDIRLGDDPVAELTSFVEFPTTGPSEDHREFTVFIHDEPEIHSGLHLVGEHSVMPLNYRAEPMPNRLPHHMRRLAEATSPEPLPDQDGIDFAAVAVELDDDLGELFLTARDHDGRWLERVAGEEQHHSSWLFGDPVTPILRAYRGDPARVRLVHAGIKETHVYHLHVHQWRAVAEDPTSQLLDSVTIGPQTAVTIDPLYGSGSRQHAVGDVIWHCHLYPHFHHGMWGLWRSFDRLVDGSRAFPDGTPCRPLQPLRGRPPLPRDADHPGFPWFIDATVPRKSPPPPALRPEHENGRRQLLDMGLHSRLEYAAFAEGAKEKRESGALFVDLDGDAAIWNDKAGLDEPRVLSYDVVVREGPVRYNSHGWHDPHGHRYELIGAEIREGNTCERMTLPEPVDDPAHVEPFFPRANHGDVVELRLHNELGTLAPDHFDLTALPVECGLHVHLVKFDVLTADGSATGWNYLSGASCREAVGPNRPGEPPRNVSYHRWVVDEEFGPCFFHDHLLANYRQKRGLFAALIAEPHGSRWSTPDQRAIAWTGAQAVIEPPDEAPYREACLAVADFVPLYDGHGQPLNPPAELGSDDDPGVMGVNYRNAPLRERGDDPSAWFASRAPRPDEEPEGIGGEPDTPVVLTYPGDRLRIRLIQGSHEEQHSFSTHGLRWRREWKNPASTLVDQQTIGISEAFTLDVNQHDSPYGPGDHLWQCAAIDDLWLGCWGYVRVLTPGIAPDDELPPLPAPEPDTAWRATRSRRAVPPRPGWLPDEGQWSTPVREHVVVARRVDQRYGPSLTDPWGLVYAVASGWEEVPDEPRLPRGRRRAIGAGRTDQPLVLRARRGEWVRVTVINELLRGTATQALGPIDPDLPPFGPEPHPPRVPVDVERTVSPRVSLHAGLLRYDAVADDGAWVGANRDGTVPPLGMDPGGHGGHEAEGAVAWRDGHAGHDGPNWAEYWWYADEALAPAKSEDGPGHVCHLQDMGDVRNHRHHGLVGALVVEPGDVVPFDPRTHRPAWTGPDALLLGTDGEVVANERVLIVQDGLRHYVGGNPASPLADQGEGDPEDAGQKAINYRTALVDRQHMLDVAGPPTRVWEAALGQQLWLRLVGGCDKPRNHSFTIHGHAWEFAPWVEGGPWVGSLSGLTAGWVRDVVLAASEEGDHAFRSGAFRWAVTEGLWGILRVSAPPRS